jgi:hypothetical protein
MHLISDTMLDNLDTSEQERCRQLFQCVRRRMQIGQQARSRSEARTLGRFRTPSDTVFFTRSLTFSCRSRICFDSCCMLWRALIRFSCAEDMFYRDSRQTADGKGALHRILQPDCMLHGLSWQPTRRSGSTAETIEVSYESRRSTAP